MISAIWDVYKVTGMCGRSYIGITKRGTLTRWFQHQKDAANGSQTYFARAIRKYGFGWFSVVKLYEATSAREAKAVERAMIAHHDTFHRNGNGFNLTIGGDGTWGMVYTEESKKKIGAKSRERLKANPEYHKLMGIGRRGKRKKPFTAQHLLNMSLSRKGKKLSEEHKKKVGEAIRGRKLPRDVVERIAAANRGKKRSPEVCAKISAAKKGVKCSPEGARIHRETLEKHRWKLSTPESCEARSIRMKEHRAKPEIKEQYEKIVSSDEYRAKMRAASAKGQTLMTEEQKRIRAEKTSASNRDPILKKIRWQARNYVLAMKARSKRAHEKLRQPQLNLMPSDKALIAKAMA